MKITIDESQLQPYLHNLFRIEQIGFKRAVSLFILKICLFVAFIAVLMFVLSTPFGQRLVDGFFYCLLSEAAWM